MPRCTELQGPSVIVDAHGHSAHRDHFPSPDTWPVLSSHHRVCCRANRRKRDLTISNADISFAVLSSSALPWDCAHLDPYPVLKDGKVHQFFQLDNGCRRTADLLV